MLLGSRRHDGLPAVRVVIEVLVIRLAVQFRNPGRLNLLLFDRVPVDTAEPGVLLDLLGATFHAPETLADVVLEQTVDQLSPVHVDLRRELKVSDCDLSVDFIGVLVIEWRVAGKHLEEQDAQRPPIYRAIVTH